MKYHLIDRVEQITPQRIVAVKNVSLAEEYLADHFPTFPVLPGVLMLEALTQAAAWLLYVNSSFAKSVAVLKEARNLRYGNFVLPGQTLKLDVELFKTTETGATFKAAGTVDGEQALTGRLEIAYFNLADKEPELASYDGRITAHNKRRWEALTASNPIAL
ncbi:MAG TPA: 3-hydroxyacyl-ACP dehydratase FabZ family protein [Tepidisphaeraceae bacterium]